MCFQVVAGVNYRLVVRLGELDCRRNEDKDPSACQVNRVSINFTLLCELYSMMRIPESSLNGQHRQLRRSE